MTHWCSGCHRDLPTSDFHADKSRSTGVQSLCKECKRNGDSVTRRQLAAEQENARRAFLYVDQLRRFIESHGLTPPDPE